MHRPNRIQCHKMSRYDPIEKVWSGPAQPPLFNPQVSVGQMLLNMLERTPDKVTQIDGDTGRRMTCGEFRTRTIRIAQNLNGRGMTKGEMVIVACRNSENVAPLVVALLTIGAQFVLMPMYFRLPELNHLLKKYQPKVVFCDEENCENFKIACRNEVEREPVFFVTECERTDVHKMEALLQETGEEFKFQASYLGDARSTVAVILSSSGTTNKPKGVRLSHAQVINWSCSYFQVNRGITFNFCPLSWGTGFFSIYQSIATSTPRLYTRYMFSENKFFEMLAKYPIETVNLQPSYSKSVVCHPRCAEADFSSIKTWVVLGSLASDLLRDKIEALLPNGRTTNDYGLSECGLVIHDPMGRKAGASGQLAPQIQARIINAAGLTVGVGQLGELQLKKSDPFLGYFDEPEAMSSLITEDGWLRTQDCGYFDEEHYFYMSERKKDLLSYRNMLVIPSSLEWVIERIEGVKHTCVVGVPEDGWEASDLLTAVVVKEKDCKLTEDAILAFVNGQVPDYKHLRGGVIFRDELPLGSTGKVLRDKVKELVLAMEAVKI
ncbi:luciferin 4-monooxygenase-like [Ochlerotatus camptorhynchus]|uniref:luciferin 4-monooxygenase-like n=1 Tax=Ochlerotatus camptorhynchus TaxID=644619 RepID=UPI0031D03A96